MINLLLISFLLGTGALIILLVKPNLIFLLFSLEILLLAININFILGSVYLDDALGSYITLILFSVAALDTSVGLIIVLNYYNHRNINRTAFNIKG
jgi:NADH-quinone oxidoreductase subunit K